MDVADDQLARLLLARDGPQPPRRHRRGADCPYLDLYPEGDCPWCGAAQRRDEREAGST